MKNKEELNALKQDTEKKNGKPEELTDEQLEQVTGGAPVPEQLGTPALRLFMA